MPPEPGFSPDQSARSSRYCPPSLGANARPPTVSVAQPQQPTEIIDMPWIFFRRLYQPQPLARIIAFNQTRGRMMRRVLVLSIVSAALMAGAAQAADMPVKAYRAPVAV